MDHSELEGRAKWRGITAGSTGSCGRRGGSDPCDAVQPANWIANKCCISPVWTSLAVPVKPFSAIESVLLPRLERRGSRLCKSKKFAIWVCNKVGQLLNTTCVVHRCCRDLIDFVWNVSITFLTDVDPQELSWQELCPACLAVFVLSC